MVAENNIILYPIAASSAAGGIEITLRPGDATPQNIVLRGLPVTVADNSKNTVTLNPLPISVLSNSVTIYLWPGDPTPNNIILRDPTFFSAGSGSEYQVDSSDSAGAGDAADSSAEVLQSDGDQAGAGDSIDSDNEAQSNALASAGAADSVDSSVEAQNTISEGAGAGDSTSSEIVGETVPAAEVATWRHTMRVTAIGNGLYAAVNARRAGEIVLRIKYLMGGEEIHSEELCRVPMQHYRASTNSIEIWGTSSGTGQTKAATIGKYTARRAGTSYGIAYDAATTDPYLRPGDELRIGPDVVTASQIDYNIQPDSKLSLTVGVGGI